MEIIINEAVIPMINDGLLSINRINDLIYIKEFIDRVSTKQYTEVRTAKQLNDKYGVLPDIITWGDYFQTEMASSLVNSSDSEFKRAVYTVKFDIMTAYEIFLGKGSDFLEWVDAEYYRILAENSELLDEDDEEILHLKVMKDYYVDLGLADNFSQAEQKWYLSFDEAVAM